MPKSFWQSLLDLLPAPRVPEEKPTLDSYGRYVIFPEKQKHSDNDWREDDDSDDFAVSASQYPYVDEEEGDRYRLTEHGERVFEEDEAYFGEYEKELEAEEEEQTVLDRAYRKDMRKLRETVDAVEDEPISETLSTKIDNLERQLAKMQQQNAVIIQLLDNISLQLLVNGKK